jgi:hypothetical protein
MVVKTVEQHVTPTGYSKEHKLNMSNRPVHNRNQDNPTQGTYRINVQEGLPQFWT